MHLTEYRIERLCAAAKAAGYDCLVASSPQNVAYLSGGYTSVGQSVSASTQIYVVLSVDTRHVTYVTSVAEVPNVVEFAGLDTDIIAYGGFHFDFCEPASAFVARVREITDHRVSCGEQALAKAVQAAGQKPAFDETHISFALAQSICSYLGADALQPASAIFREARRVKHPDEIAGLRRSAQIAEQALMEALGKVTPGSTELDLERSYQAAVTRMGAVPYFFVATAAHRAAYVDAHNTDLPIQPGDMIRFDYGCIYQGFYSDLAKTAVLHHADELTQTAYQAVKAGIEAELSVLRPGVTADEVFQAAVAATRQNGLPDYRRSHCGHGIGLEGYDVPSIAAGVPDVLMPGMVINVETPYYRVGWGGVQTEHTVVITDSGYEFLDSGDSELYVIR